MRSRMDQGMRWVEMGGAELPGLSGGGEYEMSDSEV